MKRRAGTFAHSGGAASAINRSRPLIRAPSSARTWSRKTGGHSRSKKGRGRYPAPSRARVLFVTKSSRRTQVQAILYAHSPVKRRRPYQSRTRTRARALMSWVACLCCNINLQNPRRPPWSPPPPWQQPPLHQQVGIHHPCIDAVTHIPQRGSSPKPVASPSSPVIRQSTRLRDSSQLASLTIRFAAVPCWVERRRCRTRRGWCLRRCCWQPLHAPAGDG